MSTASTVAAAQAANGSPTVWLEGIGVNAPGLTDWAQAQAVLRGEQPYTSAPTVLQAPALLPAAERRRASRVIKLALGVGMEAVAHAQADASTLATVFSASGADGYNCHQLCEQLATSDRHISPTRFHNSVHNAAAGYWGIATKSMAACQVLCAFDGSFGAGLLDAIAQVMVDRTPVLLVAYDSEYPEPLLAKRPTPDCGGVALLLAPARSARSIAALQAQPTAEPADAASPAGGAQAAALEQLRTDIPALRALPLLRQLAQGGAGTVCLEYLAPMQLRVQVVPC